MKHLSIALALTALPVSAQDFSQGSEAKSWNLYAEAPARFEATVVDPLCELAGDCAKNCGDGRRQLALIRSADDVLIMALKNNQPAFTGATNELLPFCGKTVEVDGLMIDDPEIGAANVYLVQKIREAGEEEWVTANKWTKDWAAANPDAEGEGPWFRRDPRILKEIKREGWLGLGPEAEVGFLKEWLPE